VKDALFPVPPLFAAIQAEAGLTWAEMHTVYNMGHRLEAIVPPARVDACLAAARDCGIAAQVVGRVEERGAPGNEVVVRTAHGEFRYS
jgi:phosphoribosylformylglycinamidine cyclo-ligase